MSSDPELSLESSSCPNRLLRLLPHDTWTRLRPQFERIDLPPGSVLYESGMRPLHAYFPLSAIVSLLCVLANGAAVEVATIGFEGMVGVALCTGGNTLPGRALVRSAGSALRLPALALHNEVDRGGPLLHLLLRYTQVLITQMAQAAACNRHHSLEQQLCGWLLHGLDRGHGSELVATQESIASMLGVRREGVTEAVGRLQRAGLIRHGRGHIRVIDRAGLEAHACECYGIVRRETARLLPGTAVA